MKGEKSPRRPSATASRLVSTTSPLLASCTSIGFLIITGTPLFRGSTTMRPRSLERQATRTYSVTAAVPPPAVCPVRQTLPPRRRMRHSSRVDSVLRRLGALALLRRASGFGGGRVLDTRAPLEYLFRAEAVKPTTVGAETKAPHGAQADQAHDLVVRRDLAIPAAIARDFPAPEERHLSCCTVSRWRASAPRARCGSTSHRGST